MSSSSQIDTEFSGISVRRPIRRIMVLPWGRTTSSWWRGRGSNGRTSLPRRPFSRPRNFENSRAWLSRLRRSQVDGPDNQRRD
jgi:hypothetical protein